MKNIKFLKLGTVIKLKDADKKLMIIGYLPMEKDVNDNMLFDYVGCLYPEGLVSIDNTFMFNHDKIEEVYNDPFEDEESKSFLMYLKRIEMDIFQIGATRLKKSVIPSGKKEKSE